MLREFEFQKIPVLSQLDVKIEYKGLVFSEPLTLDLYVDDCLMMELKAVQTILPIRKAQEQRAAERQPQITPRPKRDRSKYAAR